MNMTIPMISKVLLLVALLSSFEHNVVVNCIRGDTSSIRRLGWERVPNSSHHTNIDNSEEEKEVEMIEIDEYRNDHQNDDALYIEVNIDDNYYYEDEGGKGRKSEKAYYEYQHHHHPKAKSAKSHYGSAEMKRGKAAYNEDDYYYVEKEESDDHHYVEKGVDHYDYDDYYREEEEEEGYSFSKSGKAFDDDYNYQNVEKAHDDDYYYYKGGKGGKSGKSEKYMAASYDDDHHHDHHHYYYSKSKSSRPGGRPHFPDFEYIEIGYKSSKHDKTGKSGKSIKSGYYVYKNGGDNGNGKGSKTNDYYDNDSYGKGYNSKGSKNGENYYRPSKRPKAPNSPSSPHGGSNDEPSTRPPLSPTSEPAPTFSPAPFEPVSTNTDEPTMLGSFSVEIPIFSLAFKLLNDDEPKTAEFRELEDATGKYLSEYFFDEFENDGFTVLDSFITDISNFSYSKDMPVVVDFKSFARFSDVSTIKPTPEQLDSAVAEAFTGLNMIKYEDRLGDLLPSNNIFAGSKVQYYQGDAVPDKVRAGIGATGIAASAVAFTLLVAGFVIYKRKSDDREGGTNKMNKSPGDMTVAGETFAGETYDGTASVSAASLDYSRRYNDEEDGTKLNNLGSILENDDAHSVKPTWSSKADEANENEKEKVQDEDMSGSLAVNDTRSAFRVSSIASAPRTPGEMIFQNRAMSTSFEEVALQAPTHGGFQDSIMPDPSTSEDDASQMSESELSQFVTTRRIDDQNSGSHTLEIKSLLSMDSVEEDSPSISGSLYVRDNSTRRLRTVAEIEALLSSDLNSADTNPTSKTYKIDKQVEQKQNRPRTVEEIESLLTADDDDTITELPFSDEDESIIE